MSDFDRYFDTRRFSELSAQEVFANRVHEKVAFMDSLDQWRRFKTKYSDPLRQPTERRNLLTYYGIGGIGKSTLSRHLQATFEQRRYSRAPKTLRAMRVDFDNPAYLDLETVVIALRSCLGLLRRRWEAFDIAFASYWDRYHPGIPIQEFVVRNAILGRATSALQLEDQIYDTVNSLLGEVPLARTTGRAAGLFHRSIRSKITNHRLATEVPILKDLLAGSPEQMLPFLPALLATDLARVSKEAPVDVVVFMDTYEQVQNAERCPGGMEDLISRLVYLMPNVLFVVTGRNRLTWGDASDPAIHYSGRLYWPLLASTLPDQEPRQHLVGMLSAEDARQYLTQRITLGGRPAMSDEIIQRIVDGSLGLPLYLDLSSDQFESLVATGRVPQPDAFGGPFAEVVLRLMSDLSTSHRALLRAAALAGWCDPILLSKGVEHATIGDAQRLTSRQLFTNDATRYFCHGLHERLASAIVTEQHLLDDGWAPEDITAAASRMLSHLEELLAAAIERPGKADRRLLVEGTTIAFRLVQHLEVVPVWFFELAYALRSIWSRQVLMAPREFVASRDDEVSDAALVFEGMGFKLLEENAAAIDRFQRVLAGNRLSFSAQLFVRHRLGKSLEFAGRLEEAQAEYDEAVKGEIVTDVARKDAARVRLLRGDPRPAVAWATAHLDHSSGIVRDLAHDLLGLALWMAGRFFEAAEQYELVLRDEELAQAGLALQTATRHRALALCWVDPQSGRRAAREAYEINEDFGLKVGLAQALVAEAVAGMGIGFWREDALNLLVQAERLFLDAGDSAEIFFVQLGRLWVHAISGPEAALYGSTESLITELAAYGVHPCLREVAGIWLSEVRDTPPPLSSTAVWLDRQKGLSEWRSALRERRVAAAGSYGVYGSVPPLH